MSPRPRLCLGAARVGGTGLGESETLRLLDVARGGDVDLVDTAPLGDGERILGRSWPFPSPFACIVRTLPAADGVDRVEARARRSLERLGVARGYALVATDAADLAGAEGRSLWARLEKLRDEGLFPRIGFRCRGGEDVSLIARRLRPDIVQVSCSLLDQRASHDGLLAQLGDLGTEVHLRAPFAGGLLFRERERLPAALAEAGPRLSRIRRALAEAGADPLQAALDYARSRIQADVVVVGVGSAAELRAVLAAWSAPGPKLDWAGLAFDDPGALDPSLWARSAA